MAALLSATVCRLPETGFVRQADLVPGIVPFSPATLWRRVKAGEFPQPVKLSARVTAWRCEDVHVWMQSRTASGGE